VPGIGIATFVQHIDWRPYLNGTGPPIWSPEKLYDIAGCEYEPSGCVKLGSQAPGTIDGCNPCRVKHPAYLGVVCFRGHAVFAVLADLIPFPGTWLTYNRTSQPLCA
jgi:hypothetical protein